MPVIIYLLILFWACTAWAAPPVLHVLTYDSFITEWGPGPYIEQEFEKECACDLRFGSGGDGVSLLSRLQMEGAATDFDLILGLDGGLRQKAHDLGLFAPHGLTVSFPDLGADNPEFLPYDWGLLAFIYHDGITPPRNFRELATSDLKIVISDPRSSAPGMGLILWIKALYGAQAGEIWQGLADNIVTVTPGWSEAYALFMAQEADMVLSYSTSPAYHAIMEQDHSKKAAHFKEGHLLGAEWMGRLASSDQPELARRFMAFMLSDKIQKKLPTTNWMYPAQDHIELPEGFDPAVRQLTPVILSPLEAQQLYDTGLKEWLAILSR